MTEDEGRKTINVGGRFSPAEIKVRELEAEVARLTKRNTDLVDDYEQAMSQTWKRAATIAERKCKAAEATLARVSALPVKWREGVAFRNCPSMVNHPSWDECADELQAALKGEA